MKHLFDFLQQLFEVGDIHFSHFINEDTEHRMGQLLGQRLCGCEFEYWQASSRVCAYLGLCCFESHQGTSDSCRAKIGTMARNLNSRETTYELTRKEKKYELWEKPQKLVLPINQRNRRARMATDPNIHGLNVWPKVSVKFRYLSVSKQHRCLLHIV